MGLLNIFKKKEAGRKESNNNNADILFDQIMEKAFYCADSVKDHLFVYGDNRNLAKMEYWSIILEFQALFIQFIDILAYSMLGKEERDPLIKKLRDAVAEADVDHVYPDSPVEKRMQIKSKLVNDLTNISSYYNQFKKFFPEANETDDGTFFWEFGKRLAIGLKLQGDVEFISLGVKLATEAIRNMEVEKVIKRISH